MFSDNLLNCRINTVHNDSVYLDTKFQFNSLYCPKKDIHYTTHDLVYKIIKEKLYANILVSRKRKIYFLGS